jgi:hypothetical protein
MKNGFKAFALAALLSTSTFAATVEFVIQPGTGKGDYNTAQTAVQLKVGDVLHIVNNDTIVHRVHTGGKPFSHTPDINPNGGTYDADVTGAWDVRSNGPLYDHYYNPDTNASFFYVNVTE